MNSCRLSFFVVSYLLVDICGDSFFREPEVATATNRQFLQMLQETADRDPEDFVKSPQAGVDVWRRWAGMGRRGPRGSFLTQRTRRTQSFSAKRGEFCTIGDGLIVQVLSAFFCCFGGAARVSNRAVDSLLAGVLENRGGAFRRSETRLSSGLLCCAIRGLRGGVRRETVVRTSILVCERDRCGWGEVAGRVGSVCDGSERVLRSVPHRSRCRAYADGTDFD